MKARPHLYFVGAVSKTSQIISPPPLAYSSTTQITIHYGLKAPRSGGTARDASKAPAWKALPINKHACN